MFYVGMTFSPADGGYKTIANAKKAADKIGGRVYDESGNVIYPETPAEADSAENTAQADTVAQAGTETAADKEITAEDEKTENGANNDGAEAEVEVTDDVPDGALEPNEDGSINTYNAAGEKVGTISKEEFQSVEAAAAKKFTEVKGKVRVVRDGMIAIRNAASWRDGHKCGVAKTGYEAEVTERLELKGGTMYKMANGRFISGRPGDTEFFVEE